MTSSISVTESKSKYKCAYMKHCAVSAFLLVTGIVYEMFSHGVFSPPMVFAFAYTFVGGVGLNFLAFKSGIPRPSRMLYVHIYDCGLATLSVGSVFKGVLEIYGTGNSGIMIYGYVGWAVTVLGLVLCVSDIVRQHIKQN